MFIFVLFLRMKKQVEIALTKAEMPLETLVALIESGLIEDEDDPFCVNGIIKGQFVIIKGMPGIDKLHIPEIVEG